jgi:hypothetical protein
MYDHSFGGKRRLNVVTNKSFWIRLTKVAKLRYEINLPFTADKLHHASASNILDAWAFNLVTTMGISCSHGYLIWTGPWEYPERMDV